LRRAKRGAMGRRKQTTIYILSRLNPLVEEYQGNMDHLEGKCDQTERKMGDLWVMEAEYEGKITMSRGHNIVQI
jgi:hypothetical protein